jgi:nitrile hydratase accessory protein
MPISMNADITRRCTEQLPEGFRLDNEAVFAEPWQAQAFALAVSLIEAGRIQWDEWAETLGDEITHAAEHGIAGDGSGYYELWLRALERLVTSKGLVAADELSNLEIAWRQAYHDTPHGQPVSLGAP